MAVATAPARSREVPARPAAVPLCVWLEPGTDSTEGADAYMSS
jgi:hypothetical protein